MTLTDEGRALRERALEVPYCMAGCLEISPEDATELKMLLEKLLRSIA